MYESSYFLMTIIISVLGLGVFFLGITMGVYIGRKAKNSGELKYVPMNVIHRASNVKDF